jgi:WD40 repeat protein
MARLWQPVRVPSLVFARDGRTVIAGSPAADTGKSLIAFWDVTSGKRGRSFQGPPFGISCLALSPDGNRLACVDGGLAGDAWIYDVRTGDALRRLERAGEESERVRFLAVAFSPDGRTVAAGGTGCALHLWDAATGKILRRFGEEDSVRALVFSPDGKALAAGGGSVRLWDVDTGRAVWQLPLEVGGHDLAFSPDGRRLAVGGTDALRLLDPTTGKELGAYGGWAPAFSAHGKTLASVCHGQTIVLWDTTTGKDLRRLTGHTKGIDVLAFSPDGRTLASAGQDQTIRLWDVAAGRELYPRGGHEDLVAAVAFSPDGKRLASGGFDGRVRLWDMATSTEVRPFPRHGRPVVAVAFSPDGTTLAAAGGNHSLRLCDVASGQRLRSLYGRGEGLCATAYSPDGTTLAAASSDGTIQLWDAATGRELHRLDGRGRGGRITALAFAGDARRFAVGHEDNTVQLRDAITGEEVGRLRGHGDAVTAVAFSPDGRVLATAGRDGGVRLWAAAGCREWLRFPEKDVWSLAFAPDGRLLACGGEQENAVALWEVASGQEVARFRGHQAGVTSVAFAPEGRRVASGSQDFTVLVWDVTGRLSADGRLSGRAPTEEELAQCWQDLADREAAKAYRAVWRLVAAGDRAVGALGQRLVPVAADATDRVARRIAALDDDDFTVRERATRELEELGEVAEPLLRQAVRGRPSGEARKRLTTLLERLESPVPPPGRMRQIRALAALEQIGTPEARRLVRLLAGGLAGARLTREARVSLERLAGRPEGRGGGQLAPMAP